IMVTVFFGGWRFPGAGHLAEVLPNVLFVLASVLVWSLKVFLFCAFQLLIRWSLPRFRADQLLRLGWQRLLPISIANVVLAAGWILLRR
ncbi:MAG TPA: NADH-quinone oxidoreductase subunit H, partial [Polyangia bacterium]